MSRTSDAARVKNRAPAEVQLTVDHLLREAQDFVQEPFAPTRTTINSEEELLQYRASKRKEYETALHHNRHNFGAWIKYAKWEAEQKEFERARSVYERALDIDASNTGIWQKYAMMEMQAGFVDSARNVWTRATQVLPRFDPFWLKWQWMEEKLLNFAGARAVFASWMRWRPGPEAWNAYINFEIRHQNVVGARAVFENYLACHDSLDTYLKYARFEAAHGGDPARVRAVFQRARLELGDAEVHADTRYYLAYAAFEETQRDFDRCRAIYREALDTLPRALTEGVLAKYTAFEKQRGSTAGIEDVVLSKKRLDYEQEVAATPFAYDAWFEYLHLEEHYAGLQLDAAAELFKLQHPNEAAEFAAAAAAAEAAADAADADAETGAGASSALMSGGRVNGVPLAALPQTQRDGIHARVRELYERAVAQVPPARTEKSSWRRYMYLWINYAVYEELVAEDCERARAVYKQALALIPHRRFTFSRVWILAAELEARQGRLDAMRKLLGFAIGHCPRAAVFDAYIALESELGEVDRCRTLYQRFLEVFPARAATWVQFAGLEADLAETERARGVFEIALNQAGDGAQAGALDEPETLWAAYLTFEREAAAADADAGAADAAAASAARVRALHQRRIAAAAAADSILSAQAAGVPIAAPATVPRPGQLSLAQAYCDAAAFEASSSSSASPSGATAGGVPAARSVFERADARLRDRVRVAVEAAGGGTSAGAGAGANLTLAGGGAGAHATEAQVATMVAAKKDRLRVLEAWRALELGPGGDASVAADIADKRLPQHVKKTRKITTEGGADAGFQEYYDLLFPDATAEEAGGTAAGGSTKLLDMARKWKMMKAKAAGDAALAE